MNNGRLVFAVDFDGTLCEQRYPDVGEPKWDVINFIKNRKRLGDTLLLNTCRINNELTAAVEACRNWGIEFDYINENIPERIVEYHGDCRKLSADYYLDDKSLHPDQIYELFKED